jgi:3-hydroxyisobutyrate dehydrogenase-like beta-hydroxyacid dehydrogenase
MAEPNGRSTAGIEERETSDVAIGLLHPGEMGAAIGQCLVGNGYPVLWAPEGRSAATAARAEAAGLTAADGLADLVGRADIIISVCPPHAALDVAGQVAGTAGHRAGSGGREAGSGGQPTRLGGIFVDANAISPATTRKVAAIVEAGGAAYADGGIIGGPPVAPGHTRLYLSGPQAGEVQRLFEGSALDARLVGPDAPVGAASAVKLAYAAWTKGTAALVLAARGLARAEGVEDVLLTEWALSQPGLDERSARAARAAAAKGWRWIAEMEEIAAAMAAAGLPEGFHQAAAEIYRRSPDDSDGSLDAILTALLSSP